MGWTGDIHAIERRGALPKTVVCALAACLAVLSGCAVEPGATLHVDVRTGLVPEREFHYVLVEVFESSTASASRATHRALETVEGGAVRGRDYVAGQRVARLTLEPGEYRVRVSLLRADRRLLVKLTKIIRLVDGDQRFEVFPLTRECVGDIVCPSPGGSAALTECLAGQCVDPRCSPPDPTYCGGLAFCRDADDCGPTDGCAERACIDGICLPREREGACRSEEYCDPSAGCVVYTQGSPQLVVGDRTLIVDEHGSTDTLELRLSGPPAATVQVFATVQPIDEAAMLTPLVTIEPRAWATPHELVVRGLDDADVDGDQALTITLATVSTDTSFSGLSATVSGVTRDDDVACEASSANCDDDPSTCEASLTSDATCGSCLTRCLGAIPNGEHVCDEGRCVVRCAEGFGDCNGFVYDGCELSLTSSVDDCGGCGVRCGARETCRHSVCTSMPDTLGDSGVRDLINADGGRGGGGGFDGGGVPGTDDAGACAPVPRFVDADGDGYGVGAPFSACATELGTAAVDGDCDDTRAEVHPGAADDCGGLPEVDDDCDVAVDEDVELSSFYRDADEDGYGDASHAVSACVAPEGYVASADDCDDTSALAHPGRGENDGIPESCSNGIDDDCDGLVDCAESGCAMAGACVPVLSIVSGGGALSAPAHQRLAEPTVLELRNDLGPISGRSIAVTTSRSATASPYVAVTDASGRASIWLRAPLDPSAPPETVTFRAFPTSSTTMSVAATAPPLGTIFSLLNGDRSPVVNLPPGAVYERAMGNLGTAPTFCASGADRNLFFGRGRQIYRVHPDGYVELFAGLPAADSSVQLVDGADALSTDIGTTESLSAAWDAARGILYFVANVSSGQRGCGIYAIDTGTRTLRRFLGAHDTCVVAGDGGPSRDATSTGIFSVAVNDDGIVSFVATDGSGNEGRLLLRYVDTSGRVDQALVVTVGGTLDGQRTRPSAGLVASIPGSSDVYLRMSRYGCSERAMLYRVGLSGDATYLAGACTPPAEIDDQPAADSSFDGVTAMAVGASGELFVSYSTDVVRRLDSTLTWRRVAGTGVEGDGGDGGPALDALLGNPRSLVRYGDHIAFVDAESRSIRVIW